MKTPNKREVQEIAFKNLSDIGFKDFTNLYIKCSAKSFFLVIGTTLASDNPLHFKKNLLERT